VVDRRNLDTLKQELNFQYSGEVSDETAVSIGRRLGAQCIISGYVEPFGDSYRLLIRAIDVQTAQIKAMRNYVIQRNKLLNTLLGKVNVSDEKMYFALRPGFSIHNYSNNNNDDNKNSYSFDIAAQFTYKFNSFIGLQSELFFTADTFAYPVQASMYDTGGNKLYNYDTTYSYSSQSLIIPLMLKATFNPSILSLGVFGGVYIDAPFGKSEYKDSFNVTSMNYKRNILVGRCKHANLQTKHYRIRNYIPIWVYK
jgi:hypothetical protein